MPSVVGAAIATVAGAVTTSTLAAAVIKVAVSVAASVALSALTSKPKVKASGIAEQQRGRSEMVRQALAPRRVIYGRALVSGPILYAQSSGDQNENQFLSLCIGTAGHEIDGYERFIAGDIDLTLQGDDVRTAPYVGDEGRSLMQLTRYTGTADQAADPVLISESQGKWTAAHRLRGIAYIHMRMSYFQSVYPDGVPKLRALVRGKKVFDPRSGQTAWSDNPALCIRDYLVSYLKFAETEIDDASVIAAANICDELVPLAGGGTEKRYTCNGVLTLDEDPASVLQNLLSSMAGTLVFTGGVIWQMFAGAAGVAALTINEDDLAGGIRVLPRLSRSDIFNAVKATYISEARDWQATTSPPVTNATYVAQDNGEDIERTLELPFTISDTMAQRICKTDLERARQQISVQLTVKPRVGLRLKAWDVVFLDNAHFGWSGKEFRLTDWRLQPDLSVVLSLREEAAAVWAWNAEETAVDPAPDTNLPSAFDVPDVANLTAESGTDHLVPAGDGTILTRVLLQWAAPADTFVGQAEIQSKPAAASIWQDHGNVQAADTLAYLSGFADKQPYDFRVRFRNVLGVPGGWTVIPHTIVGKSEPPPDVPDLYVAGGVATWNYPDPPIDFAGFRLKQHPGDNRQWSNAIPLHEGLMTETRFPVETGQGTRTVMVKAVDTSGNESLTPAVVLINTGDPIVANVVNTRDEKALAWPGTLTGGSIEGGSNDLVADDNGVLFWTDDAAPFWSGNDADNFYQSTFVALRYESTFTPAANDLPGTLSVDATVAAESWCVFYRTSPPGNFWSGNDAAPFWSGDDAAPFWSPAGDYVLMPPKLEVLVSEPYEFLVMLNAGQVEGRISKLDFVMDVPDIVETFDDVAIGASGTRLPITKTYRVIKNVSLTLQDDAGSAESIKIVDKDAALGPMIRAFDSAGVGTTATIDATIQGY